MPIESRPKRFVNCHKLISLISHWLTLDPKYIHSCRSHHSVGYPVTSLATNSVMSFEIRDSKGGDHKHYWLLGCGAR